jgi:hypothetical protein
VRDLEAESAKTSSTRRSDSLVDPHANADAEALTLEVVRLQEKVRRLEEEVRRKALRVTETLTADFAPFVFQNNRLHIQLRTRPSPYASTFSYDSTGRSLSS